MVIRITISKISNGWVIRIDNPISHTEEYCKTFEEIARQIDNMAVNLKETEKDGDAK